jgi:hypothetical protein
MISSRFLPSLCSLAAALSSATDSITILTPISAPILFLIVAVSFLALAKVDIFLG